MACPDQMLTAKMSIFWNQPMSWMGSFHHRTLYPTPRLYRWPQVPRCGESKSPQKVFKGSTLRKVTLHSSQPWNALLKRTSKPSYYGIVQPSEARNAIGVAAHGKALLCCFGKVPGQRQNPTRSASNKNHQINHHRNCHHFPHAL